MEPRGRNRCTATRRRPARRPIQRCLRPQIYIRAGPARLAIMSVERRVDVKLPRALERV
jgi:hypothetical protein